MEAGKLNRRVIVQSPGGTRDAYGERTTTWTDVDTVWARIDPLNARQQFSAAQANSSTTHEVTLRYSATIASIAASWRVLYGTRALTIDGVRNVDEGNREIRLLCTEGVATE